LEKTAAGIHNKQEAGLPLMPEYKKKPTLVTSPWDITAAGIAN
jgi:hypothetical protein